ncbi:MAG: adenylosuccinate synthase [Nitrospiraceae bacterium]|nr:adenylosuccinate synthase [Nitrospiraceae bacterium]
MPNIIVVGTQWGDEGKGKIVHLLAKDADVIVRYQGGANAGHTVIDHRAQYTFHMIPSGILHPGKTCILGNGMVIDPAALLEEIELLESQQIPVRENFLISHRAHLILPYHRAIERANEKLKGPRRIGTTGRGIGPSYADKMGRTGIRMCDLLDPTGFRKILEANLAEMNLLFNRLYDAESMDLEKIFETYCGYGERLKSHVVDISLLINDLIDRSKTVLFEGAQGTHLDVDHGTYPFVTSSSSTAGGACTGTGVGPTRINEVIGVTKAYTTRVGSGPFPTELLGDAGNGLKTRGNEFGATTGRPRRCGWYDAVAVKYAVRVNGLSSLAVTKLDVLDGEPEIKLCTSYLYDGKHYTDMPLNEAIINSCEPVYEVLEGWETPTSGATLYQELPEPAKRFIERVEVLAGCKVDIVSTGSRENETIIIRNPLVTEKQ